MRPLRSLARMTHPSLFCSSFLGGPSSKTMAPPSSASNVQPASSPQSQHAFAGSDHWKIERVVAIAMLAIIPGSFVFDSPLMNYLLAASLAIHAHWGMNTVLTDYCPRKALPVAHAIRYVLTSVAFVGLCYFNYNDMGLTKALKVLWAIQ